MASSKSLTAKFPIRQFEIERRFGNLYNAINTSIFPNIVHSVITNKSKATKTSAGKDEKFNEHTCPVKVQFEKIVLLFESHMLIYDTFKGIIV